MREDKETALNLRKTGKSYKEIKEKLGMSKSTLSSWFKDHKWSEETGKILSERAKMSSSVRLEQLNKIRGVNLSRLYEDARKEAREEFEILKYDPIFIAGVAIYWGEGDKSSKNGFRIANSDPNMLKLFVRFLTSVCSAPLLRIKAWILLYPDLVEEECKEFWSSKIGLGRENFTKSISIKGRSTGRRLTYGVCYVSFSSRYLKEKMLVWIDALANLDQKQV